MVKHSTTFVVLLLLLMGLLSNTNAQTGDYDVTFQVNMAVQELVGNFDPASDTVDVRGSFNGWAQNDVMSPDPFADSLYSTVVSYNFTGDTLAYKYVLVNAAGTTWEDGSDKLLAPDGSEIDLDGNGIPDLVAPLDYFNAIGPNDIFTNATDVVFEVDMRPAHCFLADSGAITFGGGNVTSIDTVYLAGGAPNTTPQLAWVWDLTPGDPVREALQMNDNGTGGDRVAGDSIWTLTVNFGAGAGTTLDWKFGISGWDNEAGFGENHRENVSSGSAFKRFGSNGVGGSGWYEDCLDATLQGNYDVIFNVNMSVQTLVGNFDPATDTVDVRGSFNGWAQNDVMSPDPFADSLYSTVVNYNFTGDTIAYKYVLVNSAGTTWEDGSDKLLSPNGSESDNDGNGLRDLFAPLDYFNGIGPNDIFTSPADILFEVDMRPAHCFLADSGAITFGGGNVTSIDTVYLAGGAPRTTPQLAWVWDLTPGDPVREALQMNDNGTGGDRVAGDSIWSISINFDTGAGTTLDWKFGISGWDNEAGFGENHREDVSSGGAFKRFGENGVGGSGWYEACLDATVAIDPPADFFNIPNRYEVSNAYPNPFNPSTSIDFALSSNAKVNIEVYNILGQRVRSLVSSNFAPGTYTVQWNGANDAGQQVSSGVYLFRFSANDFSEMKKMILMK